MAQQFINVGSSDNDNTGDWPKQVGIKINANFQELYQITSKVGHRHPASEIQDSSVAGRTLLTAPDAAAQRTALGILPNAGSLDGLSDVIITTAASGQHVRHNGSAWVNVPFAVAVADITATGTRSGETFLRGDGTWAIPAGGEGGGATTLDSLTDVAVFSPNGGETIRFNGVSWVNARLTAADVSGVQAADPGLTSFTGLSGAGVVTATTTDQYAMRPLGVAAANAIPDRAAADTRYSLLGHTHTVLEIQATGTASGTTFLRGDGAWTVPAVVSTAPALINHTTRTASYVLSLTDAGTVVEMDAAAAVTVTVPPNSAVAFAVGALVEVHQRGAGQVTIVAGAGVTLLTPRSLATRVRYSTIRLRKRATNEWVLSDDLE